MKSASGQRIRPPRAFAHSGLVGSCASLPGHFTGCPDLRVARRRQGEGPEQRARAPHAGIRSCAMVPARLHTSASPHTGVCARRHSDASAADRAPGHRCACALVCPCTSTHSHMGTHACRRSCVRVPGCTDTPRAPLAGRGDSGPGVAGWLHIQAHRHMATWAAMWLGIDVAGHTDACACGPPWSQAAGCRGAETHSRSCP